MKDKNRITAASAAPLPLACVLLTLAAGCTYPGDTSGFRAEAKPSKAQIQQQIKQVKANTRMPAGTKEMALKKLEQDMAKAQ